MHHNEKYFCGALSSETAVCTEMTNDDDRKDYAVNMITR